jgi:Kef-type K+ transport system membrane component KefB
LWALFAALAVLCVGLFFVPAFIIRPFRYQTPLALGIAMALRQRAPLGTVIVGPVCLLVGLLLWRNAGMWRRVVLVAASLLVIFSATMARLNYFEWMFHPVDRAQFDAVAQSKLDAKEMIMAVRFGEDARAYPISQMAYHHILNDVVGGVPVAVTY